MLNNFVYMFKENGFWKKFSILYIFIFIANLFINFSPAYIFSYAEIISNLLFIMGYIFLLVPYGYSLSALNNEFSTEESLLPDISIKSNFKEGFKLMLSALMLYVPLILLLGLFIFLNTIFFDNNNQIVNVIFYAIALMIFFIVTFNLISMVCRYAVHKKFLTFLDFKSSLILINYNLKKYFTIYILIFLIVLLAYIVSFVLLPAFITIGYTGLFIYSMILAGIWTYFCFVLIKLFAKSVEFDKI